jgi:hypothetical protein
MTATPDDLDRMLAEIAEYRHDSGGNRLTEHTINVADDLIRHITRYFVSDSDQQSAGTALLVTAAYLQLLHDLPLDVLCNVVALAGHRLYQNAEVVP